METPNTTQQKTPLPGHQNGNGATTLSQAEASQQLAATIEIGSASNLQEYVALAKVLAESGMFPAAKEAKRAVGIMVLGRCYGMDPVVALAGGVYEVNGRPALASSAIATKVLQHPDYDYRANVSNVEATVRIFRKGELVGETTFTLEDAKRQGTQNIGKFPANMLFARALTNAARWFAPDALGYVPVMLEGEIIEGDFEIKPQQTPKEQLKAQLAAKNSDQEPEQQAAEDVGGSYSDDGGPTAEAAEEIPPAEEVSGDPKEWHDGYELTSTQLKAILNAAKDKGLDGPGLFQTAQEISDKSYETLAKAIQGIPKE